MTPDSPSASGRAETLRPPAPLADGSSDSAIPRLTLGGGPLGNLYTAVSDDDATATIDAAWELGIRNFDTAPHYGLGLSERRFGRALAGRPRSEYTLSTKVGRLIEPRRGDVDADDTDAEFEVPATHERVWDFSASGIRRSVEASLERLGVDHIDIAYLHDPDDHLVQALEVGVPALQDLRDEGLIGAIGVGMNSAEPLVRFVRGGGVDQVMVAGRLTLLDQSAAARLLPLCVEQGVRLVAAGPFNSGILAGSTIGPDATYDYQSVSPDVLERARRIAGLCDRHSVALRTAALAFGLAHRDVAQVCFGARTADEVRDNVAALDTPPPIELWADLIDAGLIPQELAPHIGVIRPDRNRTKEFST